MRVLFVISLLLFFTSCGSQQFTKGEYDDMSEARLLDDKFNETDMKMVADTMTTSLIESRVIRELKTRPVVLVTMVKNRTEEHVDMKNLTDKIKVALVKSGKFQWTEKETRAEMAEEMDYQGQSGYVDPESAVKKGKQIGAQFFLTGEITSRVQEVGKEKYIYYKCTLNLVNLKTGPLDWTDEKEIRKYYKKRSVSL